MVGKRSPDDCATSARHALRAPTPTGARSARLSSRARVADLESKLQDERAQTAGLQEEIGELKTKIRVSQFDSFRRYLPKRPSTVTSHAIMSGIPGRSLHPAALSRHKFHVKLGPATVPPTYSTGSLNVHREIVAHIRAEGSVPAYPR